MFGIPGRVKPLAGAADDAITRLWQQAKDNIDRTSALPPALMAQQLAHAKAQAHANSQHNGQAAAAGQFRYTPMQKLCMRLNVAMDHSHGFDYLNAVENPKGGNVVVFIITNGQVIHLEDDPALFPTDGLIGRLNTLR